MANVGRRPIHGWLICIAVLMFTMIGCGAPAPPSDGLLQIENVSKWYSLYRAEHKGKPPKDEEAFVGFIKARLSERGDTTDPRTILASPRDGKQYVIQYGEPTSPNVEKNLAVREAEGFDGKKLVAFEGGYAEELDEAAIQKALASD